MQLLKSKRALIAIGFLLLVAISIPLTLFLQQRSTENRSNAAATTTLNFLPATTPSSPLQKTINDQFTLDMRISPASNLTSIIRFEMTYDATKLGLDPATPLVINTASFPVTIEGPVYTPGKISGTISIGTNGTPITTPTTFATVKFKALANTTGPTLVNYVTTSQVLSVATTDQAAENILSSTTPAYITISAAPTFTPTPTKVPPTGTPVPPTPTNTDQQACTIGQPTDTMLIFDASGSMKEATSATDPTTRLKRAQDAATAFVNKLSQRTDLPKNLIGFSSFNAATELTLEQEMTQFYDTVKTSIQNVTLASDTCVECGIRDAIKAYDLDDRTTVKNVAILLSDGGATRYIGNVPPFTNQTHDDAEARSVQAAQDLYQKYKTTIYVIGFGTDVREQFLKEIAEKTGGKYYFAPNAAALSSIYDQISTVIGKGAISGVVFNDVNGNGVRDADEQGLSDWTLTAKQSTTVVGTNISIDTGLYGFQNLCDGIYTVTPTVKPGWSVTSTPITVTIKNGNVVNDKNVGVRLIPTATATPTPVPASPLKITLTLMLHGIGASGDNANPSPAVCQATTRDPLKCLSNQNPLRKSRQVTIEVINSTGATVATQNGTVTYDNTLGGFTGTVDMGKAVPADSYNVKVQVPFYLRKQIVGVQKIVAGQSTLTLPVTSLVTGDIFPDNKLDILDYNILVDCYSDFLPAIACDANKKLSADITDDGNVNQSDYNLFLRDWSVQTGD